MDKFHYRLKLSEMKKISFDDFMKRINKGEDLRKIREGLYDTESNGSQKSRKSFKRRHRGDQDSVPAKHQKVAAPKYILPCHRNI